VGQAINRKGRGASKLGARGEKQTRRKKGEEREKTTAEEAPDQELYSCLLGKLMPGALTPAPQLEPKPEFELELAIKFELIQPNP
jgi:hypothetical protein